MLSISKSCIEDCLKFDLDSFFFKQLILSISGDCDVNWRTFEGETALYLSVVGLKENNVVVNVDERRNVVRYLLKRDDVDVNQVHFSHFIA